MAIGCLEGARTLCVGRRLSDGIYVASRSRVVVGLAYMALLFCCCNWCRVSKVVASSLALEHLVLRRQHCNGALESLSLLH